MAAPEHPRRLAAILAADVVGYSRQIGADEAATLARLASLREAVLTPLLSEHGGRLFKTMGDGFLAEFASAVQALRCALAIQSRQSERAAAGDDPLQLRIGIHQGDVVVQGDDLMGDGVNIAARLEPLAEPGGITVSARVREDATGKVDLIADDLGEQSLKNIAMPIRAWRIRSPTPTAQSAAPTLPERPSIAVLPFSNLSGDPEQEYFADGVVEDIITALSRARWFFVIARNSSFTYKGRAVDIKQVGRELGVRCVLEGSIRKSGNRIRITGQLIEAATGHHIWADRFDGDLADIFDLQDRITESVAGAIEPSIQRAEMARATGKPTQSLNAYDLFLRALAHPYLANNEENAAAMALLRQATAIDPRYLLARAFLCWLHAARSSCGWSTPGEDAAGIALARAIMAEAPDDPMTLAWAGHALSHLAHDADQARSALDRAVRLNPNSAQIANLAGWVALHRMDPVAAEEFFRRAMRISPVDPDMHYMLWGLGNARLFKGHNEEAATLLKAALNHKAGWAVGYRALIVALTRLGRNDEARSAARQMLQLDPTYRLSTLNFVFRDKSLEKEWFAALRAAGVPD